MSIGRILMITVLFFVQNSWGSEKEIPNKVLSLTVSYVLSTKGLALMKGLAAKGSVVKIFVLAHPGVAVAGMVAIPVGYYGCKYLYRRYTDWQAKKQRAQTVQQTEQVSQSSNNVHKETERLKVSSENERTSSSELWESTTNIPQELEQIKSDQRLINHQLIESVSVLHPNQREISEKAREMEEKNIMMSLNISSGLTGGFLVGLGQPSQHGVDTSRYSHIEAKNDNHDDQDVQDGKEKSEMPEQNTPFWD